MASGAVVIPVKLSDSEPTWTTAIRIPLAPRKSKADFKKIRTFSITAQEEEVTQRWEKRLRSFGMNLHLPDREYENAYYASLAYILISMDKGMLHPGPLAYDYFWYRDGAYMTNALLQAGFSDLIKPILQVFMKPQLPTGEFPSIFDINYRGFGPHEWDAQGQAIFALTQYYRYTHDKEFVKQFWTNIEKAVDFIKATRAGDLKPAFEGTAVYGILPPSTSAEDLGPGTWHHYWDDFWCIKGLRDAAYLASELGEKDQEKQFLQEGDELLKWTQHSYSMLMKDSLIDWIPNGPEGIHGTSMARGTGPAVWPGQVLSANDSVVQISFQRYFEKWIEPYGGAYLHQGRFWPYAFELAECYTLLGRREIANEILEWHLNHQTFPGAYSWAEQIDTTSLWFAAGDMPHCWVAADYMNALRASLLYEDENRIVLGAGIPPAWLGPGKELSIDSARTFFGELSYSVDCSKNGKQISIRLTGTARPPEGYILRFPLKREAIEGVIADGSPVSVLENGDVSLKAGVREITFTLK
jgi:GH15 family glucan-1,4-alpha-glucosidase